MSLRTLLPWTLGFCGSVLALPQPAPEEAPKFVSFPLERQVRRGEPSRLRSKRDDDVQLYNETNTDYLLQLSIGTPAQSVKVLIDTGSFELWVDPDCSTVTSASQQSSCQSNGQYVFDKSSTAVDLESTTTLQYDKGSTVLEYVQDSIAIPGSNSQALKSVVFGVATQSQDSPVGIMGLGFGKNYNLQYNNIIDELALQGVTNTRAFSMALGSVDTSNTGVLIFGGVDTKKYIGKLQTLDILAPQAADQSGFVRYWVQMDGMSVNKPGSSSGSTYSGSSIPVVLDSGYTISSFPSSIIQQLATDMGGQVDSQSGYLVVPCSLASQSGSVNFKFGNMTIKVPYHQYIWQAGDNTCIGGLTTTAGEPTLGDTFLRSAYVVFDQTNEQISLAQYANCGSAEQAIPTGAGVMATFQGQCTASAALRAFATPSAAWLAISLVAGLMSFL